MKYELLFSKEVGIPIKEDSKSNVLYNNTLPLATEGCSPTEIDVQKFNKMTENPSDNIFSNKFLYF